MSDPTFRAIGCDDFDASVAELALEILDPAERDALLAHVDTCDRCAAELLQMAAAADRLTLLAPECEPPVGFEQRVLEGLPTQPAKRPRPVRPVHVWQLAAAAVVLFVVGVAIGTAAERRTGEPTASPVPKLRYGDLVSTSGTEHGFVSMVAGDDPTRDVVLTMGLGNLDPGIYHCVVHLADGSTTEVAAWPLSEGGYDMWAVPVKVGIDDVRAVSVIDDDDTTVAGAQWPAR